MLGNPRLIIPGSLEIGGGGAGFANAGMPYRSLSTPRVRAVSGHNLNAGNNMLERERMIQAQRNAALNAGTPRVRAISNSGLGSGGINPAQLDRIRLEERKRNLMEREAALQHTREERLRNRQSNMKLDLKERDLQERRHVVNHDIQLDREERRIRDRQMELDRQRELDLEARFGRLNVNVGSTIP